MNRCQFVVLFFQNFIDQFEGKKADLHNLTKMILNSKFNIPNVCEIFISLKNARHEWKSKTPMQKWCYFYGISKAVYRLTCFSLFNDLNHVHWFAYFIFEYMTVGFLLTFYTLYYYARIGELQMGLSSTCIRQIHLEFSQNTF